MAVAGIHGDEGAILAPLEKMLNARSFVYPHLYTRHARILHANPPALKAGSRGVDGLDLNRQFIEGSALSHPQARLLAQAVCEQPHLHTVFSFHMDMEDSRFYFYNTPQNPSVTRHRPWFAPLRDNLLRTVHSAGVQLYDDVDDPQLQYNIVNGFCETPADDGYDNTFEMWAAKQGNHPNITSTVLFEIPDKIEFRQKVSLLGMIFRHFIDPYLDHFKRLHEG